MPNKSIVGISSVALIGECMLELRESDQGGGSILKELAYGGDSLNTAVYLSRGAVGLSPSYVTVLGDDPYSDWMQRQWLEEDLNLSLVQKKPGRVPGMYMIETDDEGERRFFYWRDESPARELLDDHVAADPLFDKLQSFDLIYLSGVTLSLYSDQALRHLFAFLERYRNSGGIVAFDSNYRSQRWCERKDHQALFVAMYQLTDIALPTLEDDCLLLGLESAEALEHFLRNCGVGEIVIKGGAAGCWVSNSGGLDNVPIPEPVTVLDTTGAGDSFNGAYLAARIGGSSMELAAKAAHRCAAQVVQQRGAIIAKPDP